MSRLRRVVGAAGTVLLLAVVAVFLVQAVPQVVGADHSYVVLSGSMQPDIRPGDVVVVREVDPSSVQVGDVVTFTRDGERVTHAVVEVVGEGEDLAFRTAGTANEDPDLGTVPAAALVGRVAFVVPYVGHVVLFANTTAGMAALVVAPLAALVLLEFADLLGAGRARRGADPDAVDPDAEGDRASEADQAQAPALTLTRLDVRGTLVGFGALTTYAAYVAVGDPAPVDVAVAVAAGVGTLLLAGVYLVAGDGDRSAAASIPDGGTVPRDDEGRPFVRVADDDVATAPDETGGDDRES